MYTIKIWLIVENSGKNLIILLQFVTQYSTENVNTLFKSPKKYSIVKHRHNFIYFHIHKNTNIKKQQQNNMEEKTGRPIKPERNLSLKGKKKKNCCKHRKSKKQKQKQKTKTKTKTKKKKKKNIYNKHTRLTNKTKDSVRKKELNYHDYNLR